MVKVERSSRRRKRIGGNCHTDNRPPKTDHCLLVPRARLELARLSTLDPKSSASANFATSALLLECEPELVLRLHSNYEIRI